MRERNFDAHKNLFYSPSERGAKVEKQGEARTNKETLQQ
jgi:hypothetical protein